MKYQIGLIGLGVMGRNLALNMERNGYSVAGWDKDTRQQHSATQLFSGKHMLVSASLEEFLDRLTSPRLILLLVPAGNAVDALINEIKLQLNKGDLIIDGGNTHFMDTERRWKMLRQEGILFIGTGISGGEEGALWGPSIMPGGDAQAWPVVKPVFQAVAAKNEDGIPCCEWVGEGGAGHFVKMVHNGIEYGDMQMIGEAYWLLTRLLELDTKALHQIFSEWNEGELNSYLIEITAQIMTKKDEQTSQPMIDVILDTAGQKGTGKWTSVTALDLGVPAQTIAEAVFARTMSALKEERMMAAKILSGPKINAINGKQTFIEKIRQALFASKICSYAQGFQLLRAADQEYGWKLNFGNIALLWRAGCIIRARFLDDIKSAFESNPNLTNLLLDAYFKEAIDRSHEAWREVVATVAQNGIPVPAFSSALAYYDSYRSARLPANLLQAQRDYFGAHTYERVDQPRGQFFHTQWI